MVKNLIYVSMVASFALLGSGCGGGGNTPASTTTADTTAPSITTATPVSVVEDTNTTTALTANETATFSIDAALHFVLNGTNLIFAAPAYDLNGGNEYNVTVKATDAANNVGQKVLTFDVVQLKAKSSIVPVGDKNLTVEGNDIVGPTGLKWLNDDVAPIDYDGAVQHCSDAGYRLARRDEILNLMDYTQGNGNDASLLEEEFTANTRSQSWAVQKDAKYFSVTFAAGADGIEQDGSKTYTALCVKGASAPAHTFKVDDANNSIVIDTTTKLAWTKINPDDDSTRRAITPEANAVEQQSAAQSCPAGFRLPTVNELRTLVDYENNSINADIAPAPEDNTKSIILWSSTEDTNNNTNNAKNYYLNATDTILSTEVQTEAYFVTCVKAQ